MRGLKRNLDIYCINNIIEINNINYGINYLFSYTIRKRSKVKIFARFYN